MRTNPVIVCLSTLALTTGACRSFDSGPELSHAVATLVCGPADQGFTSIMLAHDPIASLEQPPFPHVRLTILESVDNLAGRTWDITTSMGPGAWYVAGPDNVQSAVSGQVRVTSVDSTKKVEGAVELRFPGRLVVTDFSAPWIESLILCG